MSHRPLASAFVVTVALGAVAAAPGCTSGISFQNSEHCPTSLPAEGASCDLDGLQCSYSHECTVNGLEARCDGDSWDVEVPPPCNPPGCPSAKPSDGDACSEIGLECNYGEDECGMAIVSVCQQDSSWVTYINTCNPPPAECPAELPVVGTECVEQPGTWDRYPSYCPYEEQIACGTITAEAFCAFSELAGSYVWGVSFDKACQSLPQNCFGYEHETLCGADSACQWLHPGCAEEGVPAATEGCYPAGDCSDSGCGEFGTCTEVVNDPCAHAYCDACAETVNVCVQKPK